MKREEILVNCIDEILAGKSTLEECSSRYPELADELRELIGITGKINAEAIAPSAEFKRRARNRLIEVMRSTEAEREKKSSWLRSLSIRLNYAFTVVSVVLAAGSGGVVYASQSSLPSDTLYPVKTGVENMQLALTFRPEAKANLHLKLAERRIDEVVAEFAAGRNVNESTLEAIATQIDGAIGGMSKMQPEEAKILLSQLSQSTLDHQASLGQVSKAAPEAAQEALRRAIDVTRRGSLIAQVASANPAFLGAGASARDDKLESDYFELEGNLLGIQGSTWNVGGILLHNVSAGGRVPNIGSVVELKGMVRNNEVFISRIGLEEDGTGDVKIKGIFSGTSAGGTIWNIGGIPIGTFSNTTPPPPGNRIELQGIIQNGVFAINGMEGKAVERGESKVSGVLQNVNVDQKTIAVNVDGANVTINVSGANIQDKDGRSVPLDDMPATVGKDIQASTIYKSNDKLFADDIHVDSRKSKAEEKNKPDENKSRPGDTQTKPGDTKEKTGENNTRQGDNSRTNDNPRAGDTRTSDTTKTTDSKNSNDTRPGDTRSGDTRSRTPDRRD